MTKILKHSVSSSMVFIFLFLFLISQISYAQISSNIIGLGSNITAGSSDVWASQSGDFAFGFYRVPSGKYLVGIWLPKTQGQTLIWSANRDDPAEAGTSVRLTSGGLSLVFQNGTTGNLYRGDDKSSGSMQDDGNLVLRDSKSATVWQSFDSPTDTILPGQVLDMGKRLYSNMNDTIDYSTGNFMLEIQWFDGNIVLSAYRYGDAGYWFTNTLFPKVSLIFNRTTALMYVVNSTGQNIFSLSTKVPTPVDDYYHRATIDSRGDFQQYAYHKTNGSRWIRVWRAMNDPCDVFSVCGVYGFCVSPDNETVSCSCLPGYLPRERNNPSKGCLPETVINYCAGPSMNNFTVQAIADADFPPHDSNLAQVSGVYDLEGCRNAIKNDCYVIAGYLSNSTCYTKREPLLAARRTASTKGVQALIKVPEVKLNDLHAKKKKKNSNSSRIYLKAGVIISASLAALFGVAAAYYHPATRLSKSKRRKILSHGSSVLGIFSFREFTYKELKQATNDFSHRIGTGSSGSVFSGMLCLKKNNYNYSIEVAVKKLDKAIEESKKEFTTELRIIGRKFHKNLVRLLGYCIETEGNQLLLVYELMNNGTLSSLLFDKGEAPEWELRYEMALGIAKGLRYLHEECETQIIHCDIKPQNVLLDHAYRAKIADFGLSKLLKKDQTRTETDARGTAGYMAPEWLKNSPVTTKVDVYSFGVMLLEIGCARRHIELERVEEESEEDDLLLVDWVVRCVRCGDLQSLLVAMEDHHQVLSDLKRFERLLMVGLWCVSPDPLLRPSMSKVVQMLHGSIHVGVPPLLL